MSIEDLRRVKGQDVAKLKELYSSDKVNMSLSELDELTEQIVALESRCGVICEALAISMVSISKGAAIVCYIMV